MRSAGRSHFVGWWAALAAVLASSAMAQDGVKYTEVYASDTLALEWPALSPDGRWVVFSAGRPYSDHRRLMIVEAAGGVPRPLTSDDHNDVAATWFPSGDRLLFRSSRAGNGLVTLGIDASNGHAVGTPRRLTLERAEAASISPDGRRVAYVFQPQTGSSVLKLVPANGGATTTITQLSGAARQITWQSADSLRFAYVSAPGPGQRQFLASVGARSGAKAVVTDTLDLGRIGATLLGDGYLLRTASIRINGDTIGTIRVIRGSDTVARIDTRGSISGPGVHARVRATGNPSQMLLATSTLRGVLRAVSGDGTRAWTLGRETGRQLDWPEGASPDSRHLYVSTAVDGGWALDFMTPDGRTVRRVRIPGHWRNPDVSDDESFVAVFFQRHPRAAVDSLGVVDVATGKLTRIADSAFMPHVEVRNSVIFARPQGSIAHIERWDPRSGVTRLHTVPFAGLAPSQATQSPLSTSPDGVGTAYVLADGDSMRFMLGTAQGRQQLLAAPLVRRWTTVWSPNGRMLAIRRFDEADSTEHLHVARFDEMLRLMEPVREVARAPKHAHVTWPRWSPDGRMLAAAIEYPVPPHGPVGVLFVSVDPATGGGGPQRIVNLPSQAQEWMDFAWPERSTDVFVPAWTDGAPSQLWRVSPKEGVAPVEIASREPSIFWEVLPTPDGSAVAFSAELPPRSAIWLVDLPTSGRGRR